MTSFFFLFYFGDGPSRVRKGSPWTQSVVGVRRPGVSVFGFPNFFNEIVALDSHVRIFAKGRFYWFKLILLQCKHAPVRAGRLIPITGFYCD